MLGSPNFHSSEASDDSFDGTFQSSLVERLFQKVVHAKLFAALDDFPIGASRDQKKTDGAGGAVASECMEKL